MMGDQVLAQETTAVDEGVRQLVESFRGKKGFLIPLLQGIQHHCGYLPAEVLEYVAEHTLTCYNGVIGAGCGVCPSCELRRRGYEAYRMCRKREESGFRI